MTTPPITDIPALLDHLGQGDADRPVLTFYKGRTLIGQTRCGALLAQVERTARHLHGVLGVGRGDRVAVLSPNRLEVPVLFLALMKLGATIVPLNPTAPATDWTYIAAHSGARGLFAASDLLAAGALAESGLGFRLAIDDLAALPEPAPAVMPAGEADDIAVVLYTSGTTGDPKGVALRQRNILANPWSMADNLGLSGTTQLAVLPLYHAHAFGVGLMSALLTGGHLVFTERLDALAWSDIIRSQGVQVTSVVPSLLPQLLLARVRADKVPSLRGILVSSAPLSAELARTFLQQTGLKLVQGWGLSEYTNFACCQRMDEDAEELARQLFDWEVPSIGSPLRGTEVTVLDGQGSPVAEGERGELCVRGHSTMASYYRDPAASARTIVDGWLHSGDEGLYRTHGGRRLFFITGRIKEIIIRGGDKYSPLAIERRLVAAVPQLEGRLVALGFPHRLLGEEVGAYVEAEAWSEALEAPLLQALGGMPPDLRPKIVFIGAAPIPRTHTGKIQRRKLVPLFAAHQDCKGPARILPLTLEGTT